MDRYKVGGWIKTIGWTLIALAGPTIFIGLVGGILADTNDNDDSSWEALPRCSKEITTNCNADTLLDNWFFTASGCAVIVLIGAMILMGIGCAMREE